MTYQAGDRIIHKTFGTGKVLIDQGTTVVIQFEHGIEACEKAKLSQIFTVEQTIEQGIWHPPLPVILRGLAATIDSLNDRWSVFSRSRVRLLPHQLWVCRKVLEHWPFRWLIADDVGLGKTIEAGLILWPLITRQVVQRVLILCPASLVDQWVMRLRTMFDLRFTAYTKAADTVKSGFWETHDQVVASLQTLRDDYRGRHERLLSAPSWDLVIVDEAHHLNVDERGGSTLTFRLVQKIQDAEKIQSIIFFTGTPHRGKDYSFLALLKLLRPDIFKDLKKPLEIYLDDLRNVIIRNNKQNVTDLQGNLLFRGVKTKVITYSYSPEEQIFYETLTEFILTGKAYASSLNGFDGCAVALVLIALQKLASSSVAAIRRTLKKRLESIRGKRSQVNNLRNYRHQLKQWINNYEKNEKFETELDDLDEQIEKLSSDLRLMEDEEERLEQLVELSISINTETRINRILTLLKDEFTESSVLFFTEYKATQSLLMSALIEKYAKDCVVFINGDMEAHDVCGKTIRYSREWAVQRFNAGETRFLVSTEAAGEGVDLQQNCYTLIHVDLPWNPMRLHQRVGRLYRYGQSQTVEVVTLRNPDTVEARIWECLEEKMNRIQLALSGVMDEKEDLMPIVLGMTSPSIWTELFAEAPRVQDETLQSWFDRKTARFGGQDALQTVQNLVVHCASFDYQEIANHLLDVDLPALKPFFLGMLALNRRQVKDNEQGLSFLTPDIWSGIGIKASYEGLLFDRTFKGVDADKRIIGVGNPLLGKALDQARSLQECVACLSIEKLPYSLIVLRVTDRITEGRGSIRSVIFGVEQQEQLNVLRDDEVLVRLNTLLNASARRLSSESRPLNQASKLVTDLETASQLVLKSLDHLDIPFREPDVELLVLLYSDSVDGEISNPNN
ncbi:MAG: DEAD/DEAH box helicase [Xenococcaceae cyanobacterium]